MTNISRNTENVMLSAIIIFLVRELIAKERMQCVDHTLGYQTPQPPVFQSFEAPRPRRGYITIIVTLIVAIPSLKTSALGGKKHLT